MSGALVKKQGNKGAFKKEPEPKINSMKHRLYKNSCPLCPLWGEPWQDNKPSTWGKQHIYAERLWKGWDAKPGWPERVASIAQGMGVNCNPQQAREHFERHRIEQPMLSTSLDRAEVIEQVSCFSKEKNMVIDLLWRHRFLSTSQIIELVYRDSHTSFESAKAKATKELTDLARHWFLYRFYPPSSWGSRRMAPKNFTRQALWFLGRASKPYLESNGLNVSREHYRQRADDIDGQNPTLIHDFLSAQVGVDLHRWLRERDYQLIDKARGRCLIAMPPSSFYGPKQLAFKWVDPYTQKDLEIRTDGLVSLQLAWTHSGISWPNSQMPFFYEYDNGTKKVHEVVAQILNYQRLSQAQVIANRWPSLNAANYHVPLLFIFSTSARRESIKAACYKEVQKLGINKVSEIALIDSENFNKDALGAVCDDFWQNRTSRIWPILTKATDPLWQEGYLMIGESFLS